MYSITLTEKFEAAHRLEHHKGKCSNIHGHSYIVTVFVEATTVNEETGMIMDFGDLKKVLKEVCDKFDHHLILDNDDKLVPVLASVLGSFNMTWALIPGPPTAENLAKLFAYELRSQRDKFPATAIVSAVEIYETTTSFACYHMTEEEWRGVTS